MRYDARNPYPQFSNHSTVRPPHPLPRRTTGSVLLFLACAILGAAVGATVAGLFGVGLDRCMVACVMLGVIGGLSLASE